jgi:hypothetical protein
VPADIRPADYALLGTNEVRVLWFDVGRAVAFPGQDAELYAFVAGDAALHPALDHLWSPDASLALQTAGGQPVTLGTGLDAGTYDAHVAAIAAQSPVWNLCAAQFAPGDPQDHGQRLDLPVRFGDELALLGYDLVRAPLRPGETMTLVTYWEVRAPVDAPLRLFVHLLDAAGSYRGGEDRLDLWYDNWRAGDRFAQVQEVTLDPSAGAGIYQVEVGWYDPETMARLPVLHDGTWVGDRVLLEPVAAEAR